MHLVGPVVDVRAARLRVHVRERRTVGEAERAVYLHRPVDYAREHAGGVELDQRDLHARVLVCVDLARGIERQQPAGLDLGGGVGDPVLHRLLLRERAAERLALERAVAHQLERALHLPQPAHHMMDPSRPQPLLRDQEAGAALAEQVLRRHAHVCVRHLAMRRPPAPTVPEDRHRLDREPRRVGWDDDLAHASARLGAGLGDRHHDSECRALGAGGEPLPSVDHPLAAVRHCRRLQACRIRPGHVGLGHGEERASLAVDERLQPALLLLVGAEQVQDLAVAGVGRLTVEDVLRPRDAPDLLVQVGVGKEALARATCLRRKMRRPEPLRLGAGAQARQQRFCIVVLAEKPVLDRNDVLVDERAVPRARGH